jgi:hypothetical protein
VFSLIRRLVFFIMNPAAYATPATEVVELRAKRVVIEQPYVRPPTAVVVGRNTAVRYTREREQERYEVQVRSHWFTVGPEFYEKVRVGGWYDFYIFTDESGRLQEKEKYGGVWVAPEADGWGWGED